MQMIRTATLSLIACATMAAAGLSIAQNAPAPAPKERPSAEQMQAQFEARHAERMDRLKTLLQIQPAQQKAWEQYAAAVKPQLPDFAKDKSADKTADKSAAQKPKKPEFNTLQHLEMNQKRRAEEQKHDEATRAFYQSLNASQQKVFDELGEKHGDHRAPGGFGPKGEPGEKHGEKRGDRNHRCD